MDNRIWLGGGLVCAVLIGGCQATTYRFETVNGIVETGTPDALGSGGPAFGALFSHDGETIGTVRYSPNGNEAEFVVWDRASGTERLRYRFGEQDWTPALFSADGRSVFFAGSFDGRPTVRRIPLDGQAHRAPEGEAKPEGTVVRLDGNGTVALLDDTILTADGRLTPLRGDATDLGYDRDGHIWVRARGWRRIEPTGKTFVGDPPKGLDAEPGRRRPGLRLTSQGTTLEHLGASAFATAVWLEDEANRPSPRKTARDDQPHAALVYLGPDVTSFSFVPNRNEVLVVTQTGSFVVPYTTKPPAKRP
ncbi:MAG: hypothetical protein KIS66_03070 [Fimbriimonadaceae bacterium]|nr:hypothetical protein [Fimbriimonadaceae bacterium]